MATISKHHKTLNEQGEGKCSVPLWTGGGVPAGFCNVPAYGEPPPCEKYYNQAGEQKRRDGRYSGYVPALACPGHGGPKVRTLMDGDKWCAVMPDFENLQVSPSGFGDTREEAIEELATDVKMSKPLRKRARELEKTMQCNCDLDSWEPEDSTGHSWVCRIHKAAMEADK